MSEISVSDFKAKASEILGKVVASKEAVTITLRGKPVARLVPLDETAPAKDANPELEAFGSLFGQMTKMMENLGAKATVEVTKTPSPAAAKSKSGSKKE